MNKLMLLWCIVIVPIYAMEEVGGTGLPATKPEKEDKSWVLMNFGGGAMYVRVREDKTLNIIEPFKVYQHEKHEDSTDGSTALFDRYDTARYNIDTMKFPIRVRITGQKGNLRQLKIDSLQELKKSSAYPIWQIVSP